MSYSFYVSVGVLLYLFTSSLLNNKKINLVCYILLLFVVVVDVVGISNGLWPIWHHADASTFYQAGKKIVSNYRSLSGVFEDLFKLHWDFKYYGMYLFNAVTIAGSENDLNAAISIRFVFLSIYCVLFNRINYLIKGFEVKGTIIYFLQASLLFQFCFIVTQNYRDGLISILCLNLFISIANKKYIFAGITVALLVFFRVEFIFILALSFFTAKVISNFSNTRLIFFLSLCLIVISIPILISNSNLEISNGIKIPFSLMGVSTLQSLSELLDGSRYYYDFPITMFTELLANFFSIFLLVTLGVLACSNIKDLDKRKKFLLFSFLYFFVISWFIYTYLQGEFQLRIKIAFFPLILYFYVLFFDYIRPKVFFISMSVFASFSVIITIRNLRWLF